MVATLDCVAMMCLLWCDGWKKWDVILLCIGSLGSKFSLLSSLGGLGEMNSALILIKDWKYGGCGFLVATGVRSFPVRMAKKSYNWANEIMRAAPGE